AIVDFAVEKLSAINGTVCNLSGKTRHAGTEQDLEHGGVDAVRPDDCVGPNHAAIRECEQESTGLPIEPRKRLVEMDALGGIYRGELGVQLGAMQRNVRSAKPPLDRVPHGM